MGGEFPYKVRTQGDSVGTSRENLQNLPDVAERGGKNFRWKFARRKIFRNLADQFAARLVSVFDVVDVWREKTCAVFGGENRLRDAVDGCCGECYGLFA